MFAACVRTFFLRAAPPHHTLQGLLLGRLDRNIMKPRTVGRLGNGAGIDPVVLLPTRERLRMLCRDQPHLVTRRREHAPPVVRAGARLHRDHALV